MFECSVHLEQRLSSAGYTTKVWSILPVVTLLIAMSGCAGWRFKNPLPNSRDVHAERETRRAELIKDYEQKRGQALLNAAQTRFRQGDEAGARESLEQLLKLIPDHADGRLLKAELHLLHYELFAAQREVEAVLNKVPENPQALHAMGLILEAQGQGEPAAEYFGRAAELAPEDPLVAIDYEAMIDPRYSQVGSTPESDRQFDADGNEIIPAVATTSEPNSNILALERAANSARTVAMLRRAWTAISSGQTEVATMQIRQAMQAEPQNSRLPRQVALEALRSNHPEVASAILQTALDHLPPSAELYRLYGLSLYQQQQYQAAEQALRKAVNLDNRDALAYFLLGQALARLGQADQSQVILAEACRLDSSLFAPTQTR